MKPFGVAKARLGPRMDAAARRRLGRALALRTSSVAEAAGGEPVIVTADAGVAAWAAGNGLAVLEEPGSGLDTAAGAVVAAAAVSGRPWAVVHADLPLADPDDLAAVFEAATDAAIVLAPARDGGTNVIAGIGDFSFSYGPGSFHRHLRRAHGRGVVVSRPRLALDLDTPADLEAAARHPAGGWLGAYLTAPAAAVGS